MPVNIYPIFGNEIRSKLILCLDDKPKNVTELIGTCGLSQSAVSQHLAKLRHCGLVSVRKNGQEVYYKLKYKTAVKISKLLIKLNQEVKL